MSSEALLVVVGWALGFCSGQVVEWFARRRDRTNLTQAVVGEIEALLAVVRRRRYLEGLNEVIEEMKRSGQPRILSFAVTSSPFRVFETNLDKIGTLRKPSPRLIVKFYAQASSFLEDVREAERQMDGGTVAPVSEVCRRHVEARDLLQDTVNLGRQIVDEANG